MTQEQQTKLEQLASDYGNRCMSTASTDGFEAGAQTILENPGEWGLCQKDDVAKERTKWVKAYSHNDKEKNSALMHQVNEIEELQSQLTKYRKALERIERTEVSDLDKFRPERFWKIAKEALKQEDTK